MKNYFQCEAEIVQGKRPYIAPEELVYAQPVAINPVGRPIPTIPLKSPGKGTYGPPRPVPLPGPPGKFGPYPPHGPPRRGYGPPPKPHYPPPHSKPFVGLPTYLEKPPLDLDSPYEFEQSASGSHKDKRVEVLVTAQGGSVHTGGKGGLQEHVHHHYHHNLGDNGKTPTVIVNNPVPAAVAAAAEAAVQNSQSGIYKPSSGFSPLLTFGKPGGGLGSGTYGGQSIASYGESSFGSFGGIKPVSESPFGSNYAPNSFGTSVGSFGSSDFYKKELSVGGIPSNSLLSEQYIGAESARGENYDCVCVPYDQCPTRDIIGRKDDLYLPLDPRNLKSDIEAEVDEERVVTDGNGTMTVIRVPKDATLNFTAEDAKRTKREAAEDKQDDEKSKIEPVSI